MKAFANATHVSEGWYVLGRGKDLAPGRVVTVEVADREVVAYRARDGRVHAMDARCAHLGMHLREGRVTDAGIECGYHGWCWDGDGACAQAPGYATPPTRRTRAYRTAERHGLAWAWLGRAPLYDVPDAIAPEGWRRIVLPPQVVRCHPHLVLGNGYDMAHLSPAHGFALSEAPRTELAPPHGMRLHTRGTLPSRGAIRATGMGGKAFDSTYATLGASVTLVEVRAPTRFVVLFTGRPDAQGHTRAQTVLYVPSLASLPRALALLWTTTMQDIRIMESLAFRPGFDEGDEVFATYAKLVEGIPAW